MATELMELTDLGLYCPPGDFYIDPWRPVPRAIITHAHSDHARGGSSHYLCSRVGQKVLRHRIGDYPIDSLDWGETVVHNGVAVSLHPAGHVLGSAQVRMEYEGRVAVCSGDYKTEPDSTCKAFEPIRCHTFLTESTFGLPIYRWETSEEIFDQIDRWWKDNREKGLVSMLYGYSLGKAQRMIAGVDAGIGPIYTHGAVEALNRVYRDSGVELPPTLSAGRMPRGTDFAGSLVVAPPSAAGSPWSRKFGPSSSGVASGWMRVRGVRRRRAVDRGFILSDHADWPGLQGAIDATGAEKVLVTHGYTAILSRWLNERGIESQVLQTRFEGEIDDPAVEASGDDRGDDRGEVQGPTA